MRKILSQYSLRRRAVVLIMTMWVVLVLTLLAHSLAFDMQVEMRLAGTFRDRFKAEQLTRIGIARTITDLRNDRLLEYYVSEESEEDKVQASLFGASRPDTLADIWNGKSLEPRLVEVDRDTIDDPDNPPTYEIMVVDEESKLNINSKNEDMQLALQYLLMELSVEQNEARLISMAITDWKDEDGKAVTPEEPPESDFYTKLASDLESGNQLRGGDWTFRPKNGPFGSVEELLQIPGITPELFYGSEWEDTQRPAFFPQRPMQRFSRSNRPGLRDLVTVSAGSLNINTASLPVLTAAFAAAGDNIEKGRGVGQAIVKHRGVDPSGYSPESIFEKVEDLSDVADFDGSLLANIEKVTPLTVSSDNFTIYCRSGEAARRSGSFSSLDRERERKPRASSRAVVLCSRELMTYPLEAGEAQQGVVIGSRLPGFPKEAKSADDILGRTGKSGWQKLVDGNIEEELWSIPVVYIKSWQTF